VPAFLVGSLIVVLACATSAWAQRTQDDRYLIGEEDRLEMVVHVLGEVQRPGEYRVGDDTDVLELISKAGGPTEFANLGNVSLRRREPFDSVQKAGEERLVEIDLTDFLKNRNEPAPPLLYPGDVVTVPRNKMAGWRTAFTLIRDVSVVVSAYLLYLRVAEDD
jgi:polysaccharide export outer membrane protein